MSDPPMSEALAAFLPLWDELGRLIAAGEDDERGDRLRDRMDPLWRRLTDEEIAWLEAREDR